MTTMSKKTKTIRIIKKSKTQIMKHKQIKPKIMMITKKLINLQLPRICMIVYHNTEIMTSKTMIKGH